MIFKKAKILNCKFHNRESQNHQISVLKKIDIGFEKNRQRFWKSNYLISDTFKIDYIDY